MIALARWDVAALAATWRTATPFPHLVVDDLVTPATLASLQQAVQQEPHWPNRGEIYEFMASGTTLAHPTLREFERALGAPEVLDALRTISGRTVSTVELRSYVYVPGSFLLPHADSRATVNRVIAFAFYIWTGGCEGGELELYDCTMDGDELVTARAAKRVQPIDNRLVLFDVTNASLHRVHEVLAGHRVSLTGWFLA